MLVSENTVQINQPRKTKMFTAKKLAQIELNRLRAELGYCGADRMRRIRLELRIAEVERKIVRSDKGELIW